MVAAPIMIHFTDSAVMGSSQVGLLFFITLLWFFIVRSIKLGLFRLSVPRAAVAPLFLLAIYSFQPFSQLILSGQSASSLLLLYFLEGTFRLFIFMSLLLISNLDREDRFMAAFFYGSVAATAGVLLIAATGSTVSNSLGVYVVVASLFVAQKIRSANYRLTFLVLCLFLLYDILESRTQAFVLLFAFGLAFHDAAIFRFVRRNLVTLLFLFSSFVTFFFICVDITSSGESMTFTSARGWIWLHYISSFFDYGSLGQWIFGLDVGRGSTYLAIPSTYSGPMEQLLIPVMKSGGAHSSYVYTLVTRGFVGLLLLFFICQLMFRRVRGSATSSALVATGLLTMATTGQSSIGGLSIDSSILLIGLCFSLQGSVRWEFRRL
jgi:hypothetical protein